MRPRKSLFVEPKPEKKPKKIKPSLNGRLEVTWRIYDAICNIPTGDLSEIQRTIVGNEREAAFKRYEMESYIFNHQYEFKKGK